MVTKDPLRLIYVVSCNFCLLVHHFKKNKKHLNVDLLTRRIRLLSTANVVWVIPTHSMFRGAAVSLTPAVCSEENLSGWTVHKVVAMLASAQRMIRCVTWLNRWFGAVAILYVFRLGHFLLAGQYITIQHGISLSSFVLCVRMFLHFCGLLNMAARCSSCAVNTGKALRLFCLLTADRVLFKHWFEVLSS